MTQKVPTYLSHSYRMEDREINTYLWELLWDHGFLVQIDPQSDDIVAGTFSIPYLEVMMRQSACFVAALTHRPQQPQHKCSPHMLWEYGLAIQARKPRFILVEQGIAGRYFQKGDPTIQVFDRKQLFSLARTISERLRTLEQQARLNWNPQNQLLEPAGIILSPEHFSHTRRTGHMKTIEELVYDAGYEPEWVDLGFRQNFEFALKLDKFAFVVMDVTPGVLPDWVYPYIHGRFIPSLKLYHIGDGEAYKSLPKLISAQLIPGPSTADDTVLFWKSKPELFAKIQLQLNKFTIGRKAFNTLDEGARYFSGLGLQKRRIFISNSASSNDLASLTAKALEARSLPVFHYQESNLNELGKPWQQELERHLAACDIFVALLTKDYFNSPYCKREIETALTRLKKEEVDFRSYIVEGEVEHNLQARVLRSMPIGNQVAAIVADVEAIVGAPGSGDDSVRAPSVRKAHFRKRSTVIDVGIATIIDEEFQAVFNLITNVMRPTLPAGRPDLHAWQIGELQSQGHTSPYHVVLGKAHRQANSAAVNLVREMIELFSPRYVMLVGIAGGIAQRDMENIAKGDIVVSSEICGYEYGKVVDGTFLPRKDFIFRVDGGLLKNAEVLAQRNPDWAIALPGRFSELSRAPQIIVGQVASGDKVIDDASSDFFDKVLKSFPRVRAVEMEGAGAAEAIEAAKAAGKNVGFIMVRGISDLPARQKPKGRKSADRDRPSKERQSWKRAAAGAAGEFATQFIRYSWPVPPRAAPRT